MTQDPYFADENKWDFAGSQALNSQIFQLLYFNPSQYSGGAAEGEALFGYSPDNNLNTPIDGTLRLLSKPFTTKANARNYVTFKYAYDGSEASAATARSFGIAIRKGTGEWTICTQIPSFPKTENEIVVGHLVAEVPAEFSNTSDVQVSVFHKSSKDGVKYLLFFDDIEAFALDNNYYAASYDWDGDPYTATGALNVDLLVENTGNAMTSCEISYKFNNGEVKTMPLQFGQPLLPGQVYTQANFSPEGWDATAYGRYSIEFWISKADDYVIPEDKIVKQTKYLLNINPSTPSYPFRPLVEHFTSSTCGPCATVAKYMNPIYEELNDSMTLIKYQMNWPGSGDPYYTAEGGVRRNYYGINSVPTAFINGTAKLPLGNGPAAKAAILQKAGKQIYNGLWFETAAVDDNQNIRVTIKAHSVPGIEKVRLHTAVLENTTKNNATTNGEKEFHHVMMKMLPDANGVLFDMKRDTTYTFTYTFDMTKTNVEEITDLLVTCFLQSETTGEVYQSALSKVGAYSEKGIWVGVNYMPSYVGGEDIPVGLELKGMGTTTVTEVEITGKFGANGTPVTHTYTTNLAFGQSTRVSFADLKAGAASDTVYFQVTKINGEAYNGGLYRRFVNVSATDYAFMPILEGFVSPTATGSSDVHTYLDALSATDAITVKLPLRGSNYTRTAYTNYAEKEGISAAPGMSLNGCMMAVPGSETPADKAYIDNLLEQIKKLKSVMSISAEGEITVTTGSSINVFAKLNFASAVKAQYRAYMFVVESVTTRSTDGKQKRMVQALFPNENGSLLNVIQDKVSYTLDRPITTSKVENYDNLTLVVVVKDAAGKEVLQTAEFPIINKGAANEGLNAYETLDVYPNPASEFVYLKGLQNASVEVCNMSGAKVFGQNSVNGDYTLNVQGYTPGMYVIKVREGAKTSVAKISVVK